MNEVYKAMQALKCVWHQVNNYRVLCLWKYTSGAVPKQSSPTVSSSVSIYFGCVLYLVMRRDLYN